MAMTTSAAVPHAGDAMTTLDDLARVERELRDQAAINARFEDDFQAHCKTQWADTIATFIAAQRACLTR